MKTLIWSKEHQSWWRRHSQGYTKNLADAGLYEKEEAEGLVASSGGMKDMLYGIEKAFTTLQEQAYQTDMALIRLRRKLGEVDDVIRDTKLLERT